MIRVCLTTLVLWSAIFFVLGLSVAHCEVR